MNVVIHAEKNERQVQANRVIERVFFAFDDVIKILE